MFESTGHAELLVAIAIETSGAAAWLPIFVELETATTIDVTEVDDITGTQECPAYVLPTIGES